MSDKEASTEKVQPVESQLVQDAREEKLADEQQEEIEHEQKQEETTSTTTVLGKKRSLEEVDTEHEKESDSKKALNGPTTDKEEDKEAEVAKETKETKEESKEAKPKFVFGSTTSFGNTSAFSMFSDRKNVFDKKNNDSDKKEDETKKETVKPVFGGGSAFGNAFQKALNKKSIFEQQQQEDETRESEASITSEPSETPKENTPSKDSVYQKVHLEKKTVSTGEEGEETLFAVKSKLYTLDLTNVKEGWKEKGVGVLRLNKKDSKCRLLMRADAILKVILNVPVTSNFEIFKGMESSLNGEKFLRFNFIENEKPIQYAVKFGQAENTLKLYSLIKDNLATTAA